MQLVHLHSLPFVSAWVMQGEIEDLIPVNSSLVLRKLIVWHSFVHTCAPGQQGCLL